MATIYLFSTYGDLKEYRPVVYEMLRKSSHQVIAMEEYVAKDQRPVDTCFKDVEKAAGTLTFADHGQAHG